MNIFLLGIALLGGGAILVHLFPEKSKIPWTAFIAGISSLLILFPSLRVLFYGEPTGSEFIFNELFGAVRFVIDPLSAFFLLVIALMGFTGVVYANGYLKPYLEKGMKCGTHLMFLLLLLASMELVVCCTNILVFLICWEIMSLSSFFLVIFENEKEEVLKSGIKYLVFMHVSVLFIIAAFAYASHISHTMNILKMSIFFRENPDKASIFFILAFIGFGTKAGFFPFHNWLPEAHPAAPSHVSGIMSGIMIKTGIYGILRMLLVIGLPQKWVSFAVLAIACISGLYGVLYAIAQHDLKRLLAYHSIENIGIIGIGIGIGMLGLSYGNSMVAFLGFAGGILHILNHSIFKELLFLAAGNVYLRTHTRNLELLGGLGKKMPVTAAMFLIASVAICGLPPFNGFVSEFLIYYGIIQGLKINSFLSVIVILFVLGSLALIGTMAILCFTKAFSVVFLGAPRSEHAKIELKPSGKSIIFPMTILALFIFMIGMFPQKAILLVSGPTMMFSGIIPPVASLSVFTLMQIISMVSILFILTVIILTNMKIIFMKVKMRKFETWGCGYDKPENTMEYTASSYAKPFVSELGPLYKTNVEVAKPKKLFPVDAHYESSVKDVEEEYVLNPVLKGFEWFWKKFQKLQNGNLQHYLLYGISFLTLLILGLFWIN